MDNTPKSAYLIGRKKNMLNKEMLPSKKDIHGRLSWLVQEELKSVKESAAIIAEEVSDIYKSFGIPTRRKDKVLSLIVSSYKDYDKVRKSRNNLRIGVAGEEKGFKDSLNVLFDIAKIDAIEILEKGNKLKEIDFLNGHRKSIAAMRAKILLNFENNADTVSINDEDFENENEREHAVTKFSVETDCESEGSDYVPPKKTIRKICTKEMKPLINARMTQALDRFHVSNKGAAIIIGQAAHNLGHDVHSLPISPEYIRTQRSNYRERISANLKEQFSRANTFTVHWDGKILEDCTDVKSLMCNRLAVILSSCGKSKVLGVPKVLRQTGALEASAVYSALNDWNVENNVMAMCYDTTASNTSTSIGACAVLEQKLDRQLLHFACRHHVMELLVGAAFKSTIEPTSSGPNILLFNKFRKAWPNLQHDCFEIGFSDTCAAEFVSDDLRSDLITFMKDQIQNKVKNDRHDYIEVLKLSLLFLGEEIPGYKIAKPGAFSHARWMAKILYSLKIFLFRNQLELSSKYNFYFYLICHLFKKILNVLKINKFKNI